MATARDVYLARPTRAEIDDVLAQRLVATLGTLNEDGSVHLAFMLFLYADGALYCETSSVTRKARNIATRGRATLLVQGAAGSGRSLMVSAEGSARLVSGDVARSVNRRLRAKYIRPGALDAVDRAWNALDDVAIELVPDRWRSWTGAVLREETERELGGAYGDAWIPDDA